MVDISIKNYQSAQNLNFTVDGFTIIIGRNNIGKSAIVRAIDAALTNQAGNDFISLGEEFSEVKMKFKDIDLTWQKSDSASYDINGKSFTKLNRAIPQPLIDSGFDKLEIGDKFVSPLIVPQFKSLFLVNESGSTVTEVLASLYNINTLSTADDLCQKELKSNKTLLKTREIDLSELQNKLNKYKDFENLKQEVLEIVNKEKECFILQQKIEKLKKYENEILSLTESIKILRSIEEIKIPETIKQKEEISKIIWLIEKEESFKALSTSVENLKSVIDINIPQTKTLYIAFKNQEQIKIWDDIFKKLLIEIKLQEEVIELFNTNNFFTLSLNIGTQIKDYKKIKDIEKEFNEIAKATKETKVELNSILQDLDETKKRKALIKICPLCERLLN